MRKIVVSNNFFNEAAKALKQGQTVKLLIGGHSMYPFIRGGIDLVEVVVEGAGRRHRHNGKVISTGCAVQIILPG